VGVRAEGSTADSGRRLRINWILSRANLSGGVKSNRLIAEAMARRGHVVHQCYVDLRKPWPRPWQVRSLTRRLVRELSLLGRPRHHLEHSTTHLVPVRHDPIRPEDVPDADVCIASWWKVRRTIESWPPSKGIRVHLIRDYEASFAGMDPRVADTYRLEGVQLVTSGWLRRMLQEKFGREPIVIPNGVDWQQFHVSPRGKSALPTVGMLYGRSERKRAEIGFEALRIVQQTLPRARLIGFGRHPVSGRHRPPPNFAFHLRPPQALIPELYQQADVWLLPSRQEGFGMPGLEAAACYCPVVATRCGGPEDYVHEGVNGHLVPVDDAPAMAEAILDILRLDDAAWREMSRASHEIALEFDWDQSAEKLEAALLAALGRQP
jgi:glycosyltransferase involved in cell wall biosynthesis